MLDTGRKLRALTKADRDLAELMRLTAWAIDAVRIAEEGEAGRTKDAVEKRLSVQLHQLLISHPLVRDEGITGAIWKDVDEDVRVYRHLRIGSFAITATELGRMAWLIQPGMPAFCVFDEGGFRFDGPWVRGLPRAVERAVADATEPPIATPLEPSRAAA